MNLEERIAVFKISQPHLADERWSGAEENLRALSLSREEAAKVQSQDICKRIQPIVESLKCDPRVLAVKPVTAYLWHDGQAGQLRFSVARCTPQDLPFSSPIRLARNMIDVVKGFLESPHLDGIPWSELQEVDLDAPDVSPDSPLPVWANQLR